VKACVQAPEPQKKKGNGEKFIKIMARQGLLRVMENSKITNLN
jgi:hypothetical protein